MKLVYNASLYAGNIPANFGDEISPGMIREIQFAQGLGIPVRQWEPETVMERGLAL